MLVSFVVVFVIFFSFHLISVICGEFGILNNSRNFTIRLD